MGSNETRSIKEWDELIQEYDGKIADVGRNRQALIAECEELRRKKKELAVIAKTNTASAESKAAQRLLNEINGKLATASLNVDDCDTATADLQFGKREAVAARGAEVERLRQAQSESVKDRIRARAPKIDDALALVHRLIEAQRQDAADLFAGPMKDHPDEHGPIQKLLERERMSEAASCHGLHHDLEFPGVESWRRDRTWAQYVAEVIGAESGSGLGGSKAEAIAILEVSRSWPR